MQFLKSDINARILDSARVLFARSGFLKTSMREIAGKAGVCPGNLYNYYPSKDALFSAVLKPATDALEELLIKHHGEEGEDILSLRQSTYLEKTVGEYISLIDKHKELLKILFFLSQGSSLEKYKEDYTDHATAVVKTWFMSMKALHPEINADVSDFMIHIQSVWLFSLLEEILMHEIDPPEAAKAIRDFLIFEIEGWKAITKIQ